MHATLDYELILRVSGRTSRAISFQPEERGMRTSHFNPYIVLIPLMLIILFIK